MLEILHISENGLKANQEWMNSISHNVANMQTPGFKKASMSFSEIVNTSPVQDQDKTNNRQAFDGMGVVANAKVIDFTKGDLKATGRSLDVAINGDGFLEIESANGDLAYTKVGRLSVDSDGRLVTHDGALLSSDIVIPPDSKGVRIAANGLVSVDMGAGTFTDVGTINIAQFANPEYLQPIGDGVFKATKQSGDAEIDARHVKNGDIMQGYLEMSNVNLIDEMGDLLMAQRAYQLNARLIQTADQILETINNLRR